MASSDKHLFFLLQYLELRFNKYLRLCGTVLFIIQTASKPQSSSLVLVATRTVQLSIADCFSEQLTRSSQRTGDWEQGKEISAPKYAVDAGLPAPVVSPGTAEHPEQSLGISAHAKRQVTLHVRETACKGVVCLPSATSSKYKCVLITCSGSFCPVVCGFWESD